MPGVSAVNNRNYMETLFKNNGPDSFFMGSITEGASDYKYLKIFFTSGIPDHYKRFMRIFLFSIFREDRAGNLAG